MPKNKNVLIIGAGVHGCFMAKYLRKYNLNIHIIETNIFMYKLIYFSI